MGRRHIHRDFELCRVDSIRTKDEQCVRTGAACDRMLCLTAAGASRASLPTAAKLSRQRLHHCMAHQTGLCTPLLDTCTAQTLFPYVKLHRQHLPEAPALHALLHPHSQSTSRKDPAPTLWHPRPHSTALCRRAAARHAPHEPGQSAHLCLAQQACPTSSPLAPAHAVLSSYLAARLFELCASKLYADTTANANQGDWAIVQSESARVSSYNSLRR